ncbi:MAG: ABC transporter substrate-binding protein [Salaquimonas sp.]|nr:ABC transporter substrate-binding protein [Salaquimonas sp.]
MRIALAILILAIFGAPAGATETDLAAPGTETKRLVIESSTDLSIFAPIVAAFQKLRPDIAVTYRELTTNELNGHVARACNGGTFVADLVVSSSIDQQLKLVNDGCALRMDGEVGAALPDWAKWRNELFGFTFEPAVMVYNRAFFASREVPQSRFDLIDILREGDTFRGRIGTYDIETSGVGYLFAFEDAVQASTWGRLVESLGRNDMQLFCCTADILDRVADGRLLVGYNVLGSYALERIASDKRLGVIVPSDYTLIMARAGFISRNARQTALARDFLVFLLSEQGRKILASKSQLLSPNGGSEELAKLVGLDSRSEQALRPIPLTPALLVGLDSRKRRIFLRQWRAALQK